MPVPNILKHFRNRDGANPDLYILRPARELKVTDEPPPDMSGKTNQPDFPSDTSGAGSDDGAENAFGSGQNRDININSKNQDGGQDNNQDNKQDNNQDNPANYQDYPSFHAFHAYPAAARP